MINSFYPEIIKCSIFLIITIVITISTKLLKKSRKEQKEKYPSKFSNESDEVSFEKNIINLITRYASCSEEKFSFFDKELAEILNQFDTKGIRITVEIENHILKALVDMNRESAVHLHFESMLRCNLFDVNSYWVYLKFLLHDFEKNRETIKICVENINKENKYSEINIQDLITLSLINAKIDNISQSVSICERILIEKNNSEDKVFCFSQLVPFFYEKKMYKDISRLSPYISFNQLSSQSLKFIIDTYNKLKNYKAVVDIYINHKEKIKEDLYESVLESTTRDNNLFLSEEIFARMKDGKTMKSFGMMMTLYSKQEEVDKLFSTFSELSRKFPENKSIIPYQIVMRTLFSKKEINKGLSIFDKMIKEKKTKPDKILYELVIKSCIDNKKSAKGYDYLIMSINDNIKLSKYIYEEVIDLVHESDLDEKEKHLSQLNDLIKISNFSNDKALMNKLRNIVEKDNSVCSLETRTSYYKRKSITH